MTSYNNNINIKINNQLFIKTCLDKKNTNWLSKIIQCEQYNINTNSNIKCKQISNINIAHIKNVDNLKYVN